VSCALLPLDSIGIRCNILFPFLIASRQTVDEGAGQAPYGCAPYVAHALVAAGYVDDSHVDMCGDQGPFSNVHFNGNTFDLNVVAKQDPNCGGGQCLMEYLQATGWTKTSSVKAGTVVAVVGSDGPFCHVVLGVGDGIVNAHNNAHYHVAISNYNINLALDPPREM
jgi:hypothetical protein